MTQKVIHSSRSDDYVLNFSETENNLNWQFTNIADGEIYDVVFNNVASYTINNDSAVLPFAVLQGASYTIAIVKESDGQTASITFKTRRSVNRSNVINVPDFGAHNGRFIYVLCTNNQKVYKLDKLLFSQSNYLGNGIFVQNPVISEIILPVTIPNNINQYATYTALAFNPVDNYIYVLAGNTERLSAHLCKISSLDVVSDLNDAPNQSSKIASGINARPNSVSRYIVFDYISNKALMHTNDGIYIFDAIQKNASIFNIVNPLYSGSDNSFMFNPYTQRYMGNGDIDYLRSFNFKHATLSPFLFNRADGNSYSTNGNLIYRLYKYNEQGKRTSIINNSTPTSSVIKMSINSYEQIIAATGYQFLVIVHNLTPSHSIASYAMPSELYATGDTLIRGHEYTHYDNSFILFSGKRLYGFDLNENEPFWGYLDFEEVITNIEFNRIKI